MADGLTLAQLTSAVFPQKNTRQARAEDLSSPHTAETSAGADPPFIAWSHIQTELRPPGLVNTAHLFGRVACAHVKLRCCSFQAGPHNKLHCFAQLTSTLGGRSWNQTPSAAESNTKSTI